VESEPYLGDTLGTLVSKKSWNCVSLCSHGLLPERVATWGRNYAVTWCETPRGNISKDENGSYHLGLDLLACPGRWSMVLSAPPHPDPSLPLYVSKLLSALSVPCLGTQLADITLVGTYNGGTGIKNVARTIVLRGDSDSETNAERDIFMVGKRNFDSHHNPYSITVRLLELFNKDLRHSTQT
jgi:hypothetical protein